MAGGVAIGAIGVSGAPGGQFDEQCAREALAKIQDRMKQHAFGKDAFRIRRALIVGTLEEISRAMSANVYSQADLIEQTILTLPNT